MEGILLLTTIHLAWNQPVRRHHSRQSLFLQQNYKAYCNSTSASGELLEPLTVEQRTTFMEVLHILSSSQSTLLEDID